MFTVLWWIILSCCRWEHRQDGFSPIEIAIFVTGGVLLFAVEFMVFFDLPGSKVLKNSNRFISKSPILSKVVSENEEKFKKIRFVVFLLTAIVTFFVFTMVIKDLNIFLSSSVIFLSATNVDIALALATPEERKQYLKTLGAEHFKGILVGLAVLVGILATWFYFFR